MTTPVVFTFVTDPVGLGIVASAAKPGGNFTGITYSEATPGGKRLDLLLGALPGRRRVAVMWTRSFRENAAIFDAIRQAAQVRGVEVSSKEFDGAQDLVAAFDHVKSAGAQALIFITDNRLFGRRKEIAALALSHRLPSIHSFSPEVEDGGFMSYGPDLSESYRRAAALADRILKGTSPANLPVEEPTQFSLGVNLATAKALGVMIPPILLARGPRGRIEMYAAHWRMIECMAFFLLLK